MTTSPTAIHVVVTLTNGEVIDVVAGTGDLMRFELEAHRQKWPVGSAAPFLQTAFSAWSAAKRKGLTTLKWDAFFDSVADLELPDADDPDAGPTSPDPQLA